MYPESWTHIYELSGTHGCYPVLHRWHPFLFCKRSIMDQELFRRDEIWFVERDANNASAIYSLDRFKERYDKKLSKAYLEGRYGAIPVFKQFSFRKERLL